MLTKKGTVAWGEILTEARATLPTPLEICAPKAKWLLPSILKQNSIINLTQAKSHYLIYVEFLTLKIQADLTNQDLCYTKSIKNFMGNVHTRPDLPNFSLPLNY